MGLIFDNVIAVDVWPGNIKGWVWVVLDAHCIIKLPYGETELFLLGKSTFVIEIWPG